MIKLRLEDNPRRMLSYLHEWKYPFPWTAEEIAASIVLRGDNGDDTVGFIWFAPQDVASGVWSFHITVSPHYRGRWLSRAGIKKFHVMCEILNIKTLMIEHYLPVTKAIAHMLGAEEVSENLSFLDIEREG
ncbi:hypothetical protein [Roseibium alexandrii]|uniref:N-acetyltransferase domain-containing protein n=1 Tax=Roseibium alexandrii (strain DSM 17067 / NCIMB 14079 / DFL-11) TaxID=244592 RepID=A0A5E8GSK5_ROSAD|nr:hypothetical protein [Roseibium alexandrii]EEE42867.1 hypothetical protein SADFL11_PLAS39 [Roseibium alexandrii DFL-11]